MQTHIHHAFTRLAPFALAALALPVALDAQTITVDLALDDFEDFGGARTVADLPGPDGHVTVREAVTAQCRRFPVYG